MSKVVIFMKKINLFCIPHAGGTSSYYFFFQKKLGPNINVIPIELSGRGAKFDEPFYESISEAVEDIYQTIKGNLTDPYAIYGHSMGSLLAFELCHKIMGLSDQNKPLHVFFSGAAAPHIPRDKADIWKLPDHEFLQEIMNLGGTPEGLLENDALVEMFLPVLRSDYAIISRYQCHRSEPMNLDISVLYGEEDLKVTDVVDWNKHSSRSCRIFSLQGGHFYFHESDDAFKLMNQILTDQL